MPGTATGTLNSSLAKGLQRKGSRDLLGRKRACVFVNVLFTLLKPPIRRYFSAQLMRARNTLDISVVQYHLECDSAYQPFLSLVLEEKESELAPICRDLGTYSFVHILLAGGLFKDALSISQYIALTDQRIMT
jgi:hypothetical protein